MSVRSRAVLLQALSAALVILGADVSALARFDRSAVIKDSADAKGAYVDPHNHWNGILPYRVLGGISKIGQQQLQAYLLTEKGSRLKVLLGAAKDEEAARRIREYLAHHSITRVEKNRLTTLSKEEIKQAGELQQLLTELEERLMMAMWQEMRGKRARLAEDEARMAGGTQTLEKLLACEPPAEAKAVKRLLVQMLTATPQIDFDTAYVARSLIEIPLLDQVRATIEELAHDQIGYVEMSNPIGKLTPEGLLAPAVIEELARAEAAGGPQVRWLPMLNTGMLADNGAGRTVVLEKKSGQCQASGPSPADLLKPLQEGTAGRSQLERTLSHPMVVGFDMASPERSCYTRAGAEHFLEALRIAYQVARTQRKRLVAHVHVGEGFPAFASDTVSCQNPRAPGELEPLPVQYRDGLPVHFITAEDNIEVLLAALKTFRQELKDDVRRFDDHIEVRFGHVTHANLSQAQRMRELHVWADVNLTSNLATGALIIDGGDIFAEPDVTAHTPQSLGDLRKIPFDPASARLFENHSLITLLEAGVQVVLGTDGGGIEHSSMPTEYLLAGAIIERAARDIDAGSFELRINGRRKVKLSESMIALSSESTAALKRALSLTALYEHQRSHYEFIRAAPGEKSPASAPEDPAARRLRDQLGKL